MKTEGKISIGIVQYTAAPDPAENWQQVLQSMHSLRAQAADVIMLPEAANVFGTPQVSVTTEEDDYFVNACREFAAAQSLHVYLGSAILRSEKTEGRQINRSLLIDGKGEIVARYDKIHMFDANPGDGVRYSESEKTDAGEQVVTHKFAYGGDAVCFGMTVCYDLRFPELFKTLALAGAEVIFVPAAFTHRTGQAHWEILLRARAIENRCFIVGAAQTGIAKDGRRTYGHSMVIDPDGVVCGQMGEEAGSLLVSIDPAEVHAARQAIPNLQNSRVFVAAKNEN